jgi:hypothetical protein
VVHGKWIRVKVRLKRTKRLWKEERKNKKQKMKKNAGQKIEDKERETTKSHR